MRTNHTELKVIFIFLQLISTNYALLGILCWIFILLLDYTTVYLKYNYNMTTETNVGKFILVNQGSLVAFCTANTTVPLL